MSQQAAFQLRPFYGGSDSHSLTCVVEVCLGQAAAAEIGPDAAAIFVSRQICGGQGRRLGVFPQPLRDAAEAERRAGRLRQGEALQRGASWAAGSTKRRWVVSTDAHVLGRLSAALLTAEDIAEFTRSWFGR